MTYARSVDAIVGEVRRDPLVQHYMKGLKDHHEETYEHSLRVGRISVGLGRADGLSDKSLEKLGYGGILHDIGKLEVSQKILNNRGELDQHAQSVIRGHAEAGRAMLDGTPLADVGDIVEGHHDYKAGTEDGVTRGSRLTEIVSVADVYDALANERSYKEAMERGEIERIMLEEHTFDPWLVERVLEMYEE